MNGYFRWDWACLFRIPIAYWTIYVRTKHVPYNALTFMLCVLAIDLRQRIHLSRFVKDDKESNKVTQSLHNRVRIVHCCDGWNHVMALLTHSRIAGNACKQIVDGERPCDWFDDVCFANAIKPAFNNRSSPTVNRFVVDDCVNNNE